MKQILLVGIGGFVGSIARYLVSKLNLTWSFLELPMGTLTANVVGSLLIGFLTGAFLNADWMNHNLRLLLVVGFCGGFTTFSSFSAENFALIQNGQYGTAILYTSLSIILGIIAVFAGYYVFNKVM